MDVQVTLENFDSLSSDWSKLQAKSPASHIFSSPQWLKVWWQNFGSGFDLNLYAIRKQHELIGIAPLLANSQTASFIGSADVCDYLDFIVKPGEEDSFFKVLLERIIKTGIKNLDLASLRPDSNAMTFLIDILHQQGFEVSTSKEDVSLDVLLPGTWEAYLQLLPGKQRHELRRKLRRLSEMGQVQFRSSTDANAQDINLFFRMFRDSRQDKAAFMTLQMESFFRSLFTTLSEVNLFKLYVLQLNGRAIAMTICFDYKDVVYLYNSGYDPEFGWLSAGLLSKAKSIEESIMSGKSRFDFLKGNEEYKYHLGGQDIPLYRCSVNLTG